MFENPVFQLFVAGLLFLIYLLSSWNLAKGHFQIAFNLILTAVFGLPFALFGLLHLMPRDEEEKRAEEEKPSVLDKYVDHVNEKMKAKSEKSDSEEVFIDGYKVVPELRGEKMFSAKVFNPRGALIYEQPFPYGVPFKGIEDARMRHLVSKARKKELQFKLEIGQTSVVTDNLKSALMGGKRSRSLLDQPGGMEGLTKTD